MKKTFAILLASTALIVGAGIPAWSGMHRTETSSTRSDDDGVVTLASDDDGVDQDQGRSLRRGDDDDHHAEDDDDDGGQSGGRAGPAPVGTVAPPANGLFGSGAMPKVTVN